MKKADISEFKDKKIALVLSGGVVKAASWHLGVAHALEDLGFTLKSNNSPKNPDFEIGTYVGSSAGALVGLYFTCGFRPLEVVESFWNPNTSKVKPVGYRQMLFVKAPMKKPKPPKFYHPLDGLPGPLKHFLRPLATITGLFSTEGLKKYIINHLIESNDFSDYEADLFVIATQLDHSRKVIFSKYNYPNPRHDSTSAYYTGIPIAESVAASMSVPPFYAPYPIQNHLTKQVDYYIDGEIRETLSTHVGVDNNCDLIISSWTHTPYHYHDEIGSLINYGLPAICVQSIYLLIQKKIVTARARRLQSDDIYNTINDYMKNERFSETHRKKILSIIERKLHYKPQVKLIDIFPDHSNYDIFFKNAFSLDANKQSQVVKAGYKRTMEVFKNQEWDF